MMQNFIQLNPLTFMKVNSNDFVLNFAKKNYYKIYNYKFLKMLSITYTTVCHLLFFISAHSAHFGGGGVFNIILCFAYKFLYLTLTRDDLTGWVTTNRHKKKISVGSILIE